MEIIVQPGMTFYDLSRTFGISLDLLLKSNRFLEPDQLIPGQVIKIPGYETVSHRIQSGDTLYQLGTTYDVPIEQLLLINQVEPTRLEIGQTLEIPRITEQRITNVRKPYTSERVEDELMLLISRYPFMELRTIGESVLGKPIYELHIGTGDKLVHINGSFHANESITTNVIMAFIENYAYSMVNQDPIRGIDMSSFFREVRLSVVPLVNPDGVDLVNGQLPSDQEIREQVIEINNGSTDFRSWKANIRGVDLNNQYPAGWTIEQQRKPKTPQPRNFPGFGPLTEPEALALYNLAFEEQFDRVLALHTQGEVIYWGYEGLEPPEAEQIALEYQQVSSYTPIRYVDSHAGYKDWFIQEFRRPGFTIELGKGVNPLPISQFDVLYEEMLGIFLANYYI
ncbi:M14 family metallopeptidase [Allobacillus halotolerans]|uniref:LysM peptidoglycan-binding domain-containing protein n=1 Tax=Allobacillus halotolerans TaxID=570278 RepID=A0ABS6GJM8_9BACI|nr:M14 family zinc carboxypeptidase [Allobacillus halotolerans]MBU6079457.1 LysM peptidoglycan-binding domain-containing protein [Allobacillus halotolerans]